MALKRLNRKKIIEELEISRQGYSSVCMSAIKHGDKILQMAANAHHIRLNKMIVELGGEDVPVLECLMVNKDAGC